MEVVALTGEQWDTGGVGWAVPAPSSTFDAWVAASGPSLQRFAFLVTGSAADAADLVQESLSRIYPRWGSLERRGTVDAYVRRAIVNASISRWRKERRLTVVPDDDLDGGEHPRQRDHADAVADADTAWRMVERLPVAQRAAVVLRFYEDMDYEQIGAVLDCPASTARSHVRRALAALRAELGGTDEEDR